MGEARYDFFAVSMDREANLALARQICAETVASVRPDEAELTEFVIDDLLEYSVNGEVLQVSETPSFGYGTAELLLLVVTPLVVNALTSLFQTGGVAGIRGFQKESPQSFEIPRDEVNKMLERCNLTISHQQREQLFVELNRSLNHNIRAYATIFPQASSSPCGMYDCVKLRQRITETFNLSELRTLCADLEWPHEDIVISPLSESVLNLVEYARRHNQLAKLVAEVRQRRPDSDWTIVLH